MNISTRIIFIFLTILGLLGAVVVSTSLLAASSQQTADSELRRFQSRKLADQLRQSSDDLTRMARTYVVTGDAAYEQYFYEILAIRNGKVPRPKNYDGIYWDFVTATKEAPTSPGAPVALIDLMKQIGITSQELAKLKEAKNNSDHLTNLEKIAFGAMKGLFTDDTGKLTIHRDPDPAFARKILHGAQYHKAKAEIMRPIGEFLNLLDQRTLLAVAVNRADEDHYRKITIVLVVATILFSIFAFFHIRKKIITPIISLSTIAVKIQSGATDERAVVTSSDEIGTLNNAFNEMTDQTLEMIAKLKHQITEREKAEKKLRNAEKMQALGTLAGGIAHNFNNALVPILSLSELVQRQFPKGTSNHKRLSKITMGAERAKHLVAQIMAFSRQDEGKLENIDPYELVQGSMDLLRSVAPATVKIIERIDKDVGEVLADKTQIESVIMNLVSNAFDAMEGKQGKLEITLSQIELEMNDIGSDTDLEEGRYAKFQVTDTGAGIDEKSMKRIFDPFFTTKEVGAGTGLGLSSAFGIVSNHGGSITVSSELGVGTTFDVYLPIIAT